MKSSIPHVNFHCERAENQFGLWLCNFKGFQGLKFILLLVVLIGISKNSIAQTCAYTFKTGGATSNWSDAANWTVTGTGCPTTPGNSSYTNNVTIIDGASVSLDVNNQTISTLLLNDPINGSGLSLTLNSNTLTVTSSVSFSLPTGTKTQH